MLLLLMFAFCTVCQAQKLSIKPYFLYHHSVSSQEEPVFYDIYVPNGYYIPVPLRLLDDDFSLATGLEYGLAMAYTFRNQLGIELDFGYFSGLNSTDKKIRPKDDNWWQSKPVHPYTIDWNYHSIAVRPLFSYAVVKRKSVFIGKIGPSIHYVSATMEAFLWDEKLSTCTFADKLNWGYSTALEYNYQCSKQLSLAVEVGYEQYQYTPNKATVKYEEKYASVRKGEEILYVKEIVREPMAFQTPPLQNKRLKESILLNNIYFGIGVKYNLWKK